jgi:hypothetical protein
MEVGSFSSHTSRVPVLSVEHIDLPIIAFSAKLVLRYP